MILVGLVLACLAPRAVMAWKQDFVCRDGVFYLELAEALEQGDIAGGFGALGLNVYPVVLASLHRAGFDPIAGGKIWGVVAASLAVLPLFGWVRRQFDARVACVAGVMYACHPMLIEWSPELVREQTFWFLWLLSLYLLWRAVTEVRLAWFLAAGASVTLAIHTRFEGWFLFVPLVAWSAWRMWYLPSARPRLAGGVLATMTVCPLLLWAVNVTWLGDQPKWEWGNFQRLEYVALWWRATSEHVTDRDVAAAAAPTTPPPSSAPAVMQTPARRSLGWLAWEYVHNLRRGLDAVYAVFMLGGIWAWRRLWLRGDQQPLFWTALCILGGIWVHLWYAEDTSSRYASSIVLLAAPFAALGVLSFASRLGRLMEWASHRRPTYSAALTVLLGAIVVFGWSDALSSGRDRGRASEAALGRWIGDEFGPSPRVLLPDQMKICKYYAGKNVQVIPTASQSFAPVELLDAARPDVAVFSRRRSPSDAYELFVRQAARLGFETVPSERLPLACDANDLVVVRR